MKDDRSIPPLRDLPPGRLAQRRAHLISEVAREGNRPRSRRNRLLLLAATLPLVTAVGLFVTSPWKRSPAFLERAQAALAPPAGSILHYRYEETLSARALGCTVRTAPREVWIDQTAPHRYRALLPYVGDGEAGDVGVRSRVCHDHRTSEIGGALDTQEQPLVFVPPDTLRSVPARFLGFSTDPAAELRRAIDDGSAHDQGRIELRGRMVERIRVDPRRCADPPCPAPPHAGHSVYVDPETFALVQEKWPNVVVRYLTFEYLPRTPTNLALTDIRAQHPNAAGP